MKHTNHPVAIQLTNISKKYEIHHEKPTLVEKFIKGRNETFWALKNIDLLIKKGERIGIVGPNGSGKTTLLKIIAGITTPSRGTVQTFGRIVSLIDLEAGFHQDLTGLQNIYLNGILLGMSRSELDKKTFSIIQFADIRQFIDAPLFTYSSGMALRLGFAVAVHADPTILLLDEGLSVGDKNFRKKSTNKIHELMRKNITVVMVSHQLDMMKTLCSRFIILEKGSLIDDGQQKMLLRHGYI
jgi:ABC-2 type transport system ATP-binding protein